MTYEHSKKLHKQVTTYLNEQFGIEVNSQRFAFAASKHKVYCVSPALLPILNTVPIQKIGVPVLKKTRDDFRPLHNLGLIFGHLSTKNTASINTNDLQEYVVHKDIPFSQFSDTTLGEGNTYFIIQRNGKGVGIGKRVNESVKNKFLKW